MPLSLQNFLLLAVVLFTEAWVLSVPGWESGAAFLSAVASLFAVEPIKRHFGWGAARSAHDRHLFDRYLAELPSEPTMQFLTEQNFGDSFRRDRLEPLDAFSVTWNTVEREFIDKTLQLRLRRVKKAIGDFLTAVSTYTVPTRNLGLLSVYSDAMRDHGGPRPQHIRDQAKKLNELAREVVLVHQEFIRVAREKLDSDRAN